MQKKYKEEARRIDNFGVDPHKTYVRTEIFTFCEYATQKGGNLSINGTFESWESDVLPIEIPQYHIVTRVRLPRTNPVAKCLLILLDPDGDLVFKPAEMNMAGAAANYIFTNRNTRLKKFGIYYAAIVFEKKVISSIPLVVRKVGELDPTLPRMN